MNLFIRNLDELLYLASRKASLTDNLKKNYKENIHYIKYINIKTDVKQNGGQNKIIYLLTEEAFELFKNSYNFRNRYIVDVSDNIKCVNIGMCVENQTIGFIENSFKGIIDCKRQFIIDKYRVDLYFINYKLIIDNNSGTFSPSKEHLPLLEKLFKENFHDILVEAYDRGDPKLAEYIETDLKN